MRCKISLVNQYMTSEILALFIMSEILAYMFSLHYRPFSVHITSLMHSKSSSLNDSEYFSINNCFYDQVLVLSMFHNLLRNFLPTKLCLDLQSEMKTLHSYKHDASLSNFQLIVFLCLLHIGSKILSKGIGLSLYSSYKKEEEDGARGI